MTAPHIFAQRRGEQPRRMDGKWLAVKINYSYFMSLIIYALEQSMQQLAFDREDV